MSSDNFELIIDVLKQPTPSVQCNNPSVDQPTSRSNRCSSSQRVPFLHRIDPSTIDIMLHYMKRTMKIEYKKEVHYFLMLDTSGQTFFSSIHI